MSGSWRVFSSWSRAATSARGTDFSIGGEKTRLASPPHSGHGIESGALPSGTTTSKSPSWPHRYSYVAIGRSLPRQSADFGTDTPCVTWWGVPLPGATSKSKIRLGMYTVAHEFGMSTTPENRPSIGAEPRIMYAWMSE